jgi:arylsulfatase A-like enzyme
MLLPAARVPYRGPGLWLVVLQAALALVAEAVPGSAAEVPRRPNLLVIITDQQHAGMMSCAGNPWLKTPAMDRLAASGTRFELAYSANPVCVPARVSMMTGFLPSRFGMRSNAEARNQLPAESLKQCMGWIFREAGYETVYGGKTHWFRNMTPQSIGFEMLTRDERDGLAEACETFFRRKRERPFLLVASFINPHDICYMAIDAHARSKGTEPLYPKSVIERKTLAAALEMPAGVSREEFFARLCPPLPANFEVPALEPECLSTHYVPAGSFRDYVRKNWSEEDWRMHRWAYCRLTEMVDRQIGRVLDALRQTGLEQDTLVVFTSDHGDHDASHRLEHKSELYENACRVPLIVSLAGATPPGKVDQSHLVSAGLDLIPTLCDYAGIRPPAGLLGKSLRDLAEGRKPAAWRDQVVVESLAGRMVRTGRYKYNVYATGAHREQLFDLEADPGEMINLAEDSKHRTVLDEHRARLKTWARQTGDPALGTIP